MGTFRYGLGVARLQVDDNTLAHLQFLLNSKLRRGENFILSWDVPPESGSGRASVWIDSSVQMHFKYDDARAARLDRELLEEMAVASTKAAGLDLSDPATTHNPHIS